MGREIKRVAAGFEWPMSTVWTGFVTPYSAQPCKVCDQTGSNPATKKIGDDFYGDYSPGSKRWCDNITQDEVQALVDSSRLMDFTHTFVPGKGWQKKDPPYVPTAAEVNKWELGRGLGHDAINRWILIEARATRLGVYGKCPHCHGEGELWFSPEIKAAADAWESQEPPAGDWWQVWETVSEGSPVTPAFATREELIAHLVEGGDAWDRKRGEGGWSRAAAEEFVGSGWAPSMAVIDGVVREARDGFSLNGSERQT